jgi:hypothetical protein
MWCYYPSQYRYNVIHQCFPQLLTQKYKLPEYLLDCWQPSSKKSTTKKQPILKYHFLNKCHECKRGTLECAEKVQKQKPRDGGAFPLYHLR